MKSFWDYPKRMCLMICSNSGVKKNEERARERERTQNRKEFAKLFNLHLTFPRFLTCARVKDINERNSLACASRNPHFYASHRETERESTAMNETASEIHTLTSTCVMGALFFLLFFTLSSVQPYSSVYASASARACNFANLSSIAIAIACRNFSFND